jgi:hypothetical protein
MLKKLFFLNIALMFCQVVTLKAQSISPKVISSAGGTATFGSTIVNYNVGEPVIGTLTGGNYQITQGFEQQGGQNTLINGIISYWKLDETSGATVAVDAAGGGNNGTNTADTSGVPGVVNTGYGFNGVTANSKIDFPNSNSTSSNLNLTTSGTISVWVLVPVAGASYIGGIVNRETAGANAMGYTIFYEGGDNLFSGEFSSGGGQVETFDFTGVPVGSNKWYHLVVTWNGTTITTYMNGGHAKSYGQTVTPSSNANLFSIGYNAVYTDDYWRGRIDEVGLWNRALTAGEDSLLYANGNGNQYPFNGNANVLPVAKAGANQMLATGTTSTTLNGSSSTGTSITYAWTKISGPTGGTITSPAAAITTITGLTTGTYTYQLTVTDNLSNTAFSIVNVTVNPVPTANAGPDQTLAAGTTTGSLSGSGTGTGITYSWAQIGGPLPYATIASPSSASTSITNLIAGIDSFRLTVTDTLGTIARDTVIITVNPYPTANAGTNQILASTATTTNLSGAASGNGLTYLWSQTGGPSAGITQSNALKTPITGLTSGNTYTFQLTVTDNKGAQATSTVTVSTTGSPTGLLNGLISYWNLNEPSGSSTAFDNAGGGNNGTNIADTVGVPGKIYTAYGFNGTTSKIVMANTNSNTSNLNLTASGSLSAWVKVPIINPNAPGYDYKDFGPSGYYEGTVLAREKSGSNGIGYVIYYSSYTNTFQLELTSGVKDSTYNFQGHVVDTNWIHVGATWDGSHVTTYMNGANANKYTSTFGPGSNTNLFSIGYDTVDSQNPWRGRIDEVGIWSRALTAGEDSLLYGAGYGNPYPFNSFPTANAGTNQYLTATTTSTTLSGSGTGTSITYAWTKTAGASANITSPSAASTGITALAVGAYTFRLTVTDNRGAQATSTVNITVDPVPTANAGQNQALPYTTSTTLGGSATGSNLSYAWTETAGATATITSPAQLSTTATGLAPGAYSFLLTVTDSAGQQATGAMNVTVNQLVTANAGPDQALTGGTTTTTLNGTGSGTGISYSWNQVGGPGATIASPSSSSTSITGLTAGIDSFKLTVTDNIGTKAVDTVIITINPIPSAYAGTNQTLYQSTASTTLSGTASGTGITYHWSQTGGTTATITSPTSLKTTITGLSAGLSTFLLTVTDNLGTQATSSVTVNIYGSGAPSLLNGLISYWNLDEASGNTAFDNAGGGNNGTDTGDTLGVSGRINTAYGFNGTTSKIDMANTNTLTSNLNLTTSGSISAWVLIPIVHKGYDYTDFGALGYYYGQIVSRESSGGNAIGYTIYYLSYSNSFTVELASGGGTYQDFNFNDTAAVVANTWIHLVVTWGGGTVTTYMNGGNANSTTTTKLPGSNSNPFSIGYNATNSTNYWRGRIDEVGFWNRALTSNEVSSLYNSDLGYAYPFAPLGGTPVGAISAVPSQPLITNDANTSVTAYPNPYSTEVNFNMKSSVAGRGSLTLYDLLGRKVATVFEGDLTAGLETKATYQLGAAKRQVLIYLFTVGDKTVQGKLIPGEY